MPAIEDMLGPPPAETGIEDMLGPPPDDSGIQSLLGPPPETNPKGDALRKELETVKGQNRFANWFAQPGSVLGKLMPDPGEEGSVEQVADTAAGLLRSGEGYMPATLKAAAAIPNLFPKESIMSTENLAKVGAGAARSGVGVVEGMTTPEMLPLAPLAAIPLVAPAMGLLFGSEAIMGGAGELSVGLKTKDPAVIGSGLGQVAVGASMAAHPGGKLIKPIISDIRQAARAQLPASVAAAGGVKAMAPWRQRTEGPPPITELSPAIKDLPAPEPTMPAVVGPIAPVPQKDLISEAMATAEADRLQNKAEVLAVDKEVAGRLSGETPPPNTFGEQPDIGQKPLSRTEPTTDEAAKPAGTAPETPTVEAAEPVGAAIAATKTGAEPFIGTAIKAALEQNQIVPRGTVGEGAKEAPKTEAVAEAVSLAEFHDPNNTGALLGAFQHAHKIGDTGIAAQKTAWTLYAARSEKGTIGSLKEWMGKTKKIEELMRGAPEASTATARSIIEPESTGPTSGRAGEGAAISAAEVGYSFKESDVRTDKPSTRRTTRPTGTDIETKIEVRAPIEITDPKNWASINPQHTTYEVSARGNFEKRTPPKKADKVWGVYNPRLKEWMTQGLTQADAIAFAKREMVNRNLPQPTPAPPAATAKPAAKMQAEVTEVATVQAKPQELIAAEDAAQAAFEKLGAAERGAYDKSKRKGMNRAQLAKLKEFDAIAAVENDLKNKWQQSKPKAPLPSEPPSAGGEIIGMGGAVPKEFKPSQMTPTANKNASIDADRIKRGEKPLLKTMRLSDPDLWDSAMAAIDDNFRVADEIILELKHKPRVPSDKEIVILLQRRVDLKNTFAGLSREYADRSADGMVEMAEAAKAGRAEILEQLQDLEVMLGTGDTAAGTMAGRALRARRLMMNEDFSLETLTVERQIDLGRKLTEPETAEVERISNDYKAKSDALEAKEAELTAKAEKLELQRLEQQAAADKALDEPAPAVAPKYSPFVLKAAEKIVSFERAERVSALEAFLNKHRPGPKPLESMGAAGPEDFIRSQEMPASFMMDAEDLTMLSKIGKGNLVDTGLDFEAWKSKMIGDIGAWIEPQLGKVWERTKKDFDADNNRTPSAYRKAVKAAVTAPKGKPIATVDTVVERLVKSYEKNPNLNFSVQARKIARMLWVSGIRDPLKLRDAVHTELAKAIPDLTPRQAMDALSGYGKYSHLSKDEVSVGLRDAYGQYQQLAKLDDMAKGTAPQKTGFERRSPSDAERRLIKQVEAKKKEGGYDVTDPARELASAMQAAEKRLINQIADLEHEISTRERIVKDKRKLEYDDKLKGLVERRDALREQHDAIFKQPMDDAQRLVRWKELVQKRIDNYKEMKRTGNIFPKAKPTPVRLDSEAIKLRFELHKVHNALMDMRLKDKLSKRNAFGKVLDGAGNTIRFSRAVITGGEFSGVLRQGGFIFAGHPVLGAKALPSMFRALMSEEAQFKINEEIQTRSNAPLYERHKLEFTEAGVRLSTMEEHYMFRVAEGLRKVDPNGAWPKKAVQKVTSTGIKIVEAFQRAYTTYLNRLRADAFDALVDAYGDAPVMLDQIANLINVSTGRGSKGVARFVGAGSNTVFFAPRFSISRFQLLAGQPLWRGNAATRQMVVKQYLRALGGAAVVFALGSMAGGTIETDPRSPKGWKLNFGKGTFLDPLAGLQQATRVAATLITRKRIDKDGKLVPIIGKLPPFSPDMWTVLANFLRTKLSPAVGGSVSWWSEKDPTGQPFGTKDLLKQSFSPMTWGDMIDVLDHQDNKAKAAIIDIMLFFGMGAQNWDERKRK